MQRKIGNSIAENLVGLVFLFSGLTKVVDPQGMSIKLMSYFQVWHFSCPKGITLTLVFLLTMLEIFLAILLLLRVGWRWVYGVTLGLVSLFTILTAYIYIYNPVPDCGCFGDAIALTHGQTLLKNIILMCLVVSLLFKGRQRHGFKSVKIKIATAVLVQAICVGGFLYSLSYETPICFTAWHVGANIREAIEGEGDDDKDINELALFYAEDSDGNDYSFDIVYDDHDVVLIIVPNPQVISYAAFQRAIKDLKNSLDGWSVKFFLLTSQKDSRLHKISSSLSIPYLIGETKQLHAMTRQKSGLMLMRKGEIEAKWSVEQAAKDYKKSIVRVVEGKEKQWLSHYPYAFLVVIALAILSILKIAVYGTKN